MSKITVTELDFDLIKQELINYLSNQSEFTEYDFEGSALNILMDVLAYNTHMNAYLANMMANESFLDSADIRENVVSKAKEIGYTPRSVRSSKAIIDVQITGVTGSPPFIEMPEGTQFIASNADYIFSTIEPLLLYPITSSTYEVKNVDIYEGPLVTYQYIVNLTDPDQRFIINNPNADISTLKVYIKDSESSINRTLWSKNADLNVLTPEDEIYFVSENINGLYEITFGDDILGKALSNGNVIILTYIVSTAKEDANFIDTFQPYTPISGYSTIIPTTVDSSYGGAEQESIESIKLLAPRYYQSQRRAVTLKDYETFLLRDYPFIDSINSWGGEDNDPPIYGKVFFAIKPRHTDFLSNKKKEEIKNDLIRKYNVVTIIPEIVDPEYIYLSTETTLYVKKTETTLTSGDLILQTENEIKNYFASTTKKFKTPFYISPLLTNIDNIDTAIKSTLMNINMQIRIIPIVNLYQTWDLKFNNEIIPGTVYSSYYNTENTTIPGSTIETMIKDDGNGKLYTYDVSNEIVINNNIGTINYETGALTFTIHAYGVPLDTLDIRINCTPRIKNINTGNNQIIVPDETALNSNVNRRKGISVTIEEIT